VELARPVWGINHILSYGQSYSHGWEGSPTLTRTPKAGTLMLGESVRPLSESAPVWQAVGAPVFRPLRATMQEHFGGPVLSDDAEPDLLGETILETAIGHWRGRMRQDGGAADSDLRLLGSACGVGSRSIEALSRGAEPDLFNRIRDCVRLAMRAAQAEAISYGIVAILLLQGEHNNFAMGGTGDTTKYAELMEQLYADLITDVVHGIAGQEFVPALFIYQTGGLQASRTNSIPQAQLVAALTMPGCYMVGPAYPVPTKHDHPDPNGYRWLGAQFGKIMHRVLSRGERWLPLHPVAAARDGSAVRLIFHVPQPPLLWGHPFLRQRANEAPDRGFQLFDSHGEVPIAGVALSGATEVRVVPARPLGANALVRYAGADRGGCGNLRDSDPAVADECYEYRPGAGHWPTAELPDLIGKPYPLHNWCAAFTIAIS